MMPTQNATQLPKNWQDVTSDLGIAYIEAIKEAPFWIHVSLIGLVAFVVSVVALYKYHKMKLDRLSRNEGHNVPIDALVQVITEASAQSSSSAAVIQELAEQLGSVGNSVSSLTSQVKSVTMFSEDLANLVRDVAGSVDAMSEQLRSMGDVSKSLDQTVKEVQEIMAGCNFECIHHSDDSTHTSSSTKQ